MRPVPRARAWATLAVVALALPARAQTGGAGAVPEAAKLVRVTAPAVHVQAGGRTEASFTLRIAPSWHINANPPSPDYMIPTVLELEAGFGVKPGSAVYPMARPLKVEFEDGELLVYDGEARVGMPLSVAANAASGTHTLAGKLQFQACNDRVCLAPASVPIALEVVVAGGDPAGTGPGATPRSSGSTTEGAVAVPPPASGANPPTPSGPGFATGPPAAGDRSAAALQNPLARALERGGLFSFVTLFLIGLALNLTPCVYPMLGVTVSIFGARRAAPPLQVLGLALLYVLGMAMMYSALGLVAAFTGGLFGGLLQSPAVQLVIGALLVALSLSMFGLYEFQLPPQLLSRLGGTTATSAAGVFLSGLLVGVFAAPCIGPPVVALLALVGARGDPWFGFSSFFVLSMGLGAPYLALATFSNLLQSLPRSGEWMVWVKKVFGVVLLALGAFYALLAVASDRAGWVAPAALVLGGLYLGFLERSAEGRTGFRWLKRAGGAAAMIGGVAIALAARSEGVRFEAFTPQGLDAALRSGAPAMLDFTANWCAPCHELERFTFTDPRVREGARAFRTFRVDLTRYNSPESEQLRRAYRIAGVPTVVFMAPDGTEVPGSRVEGFMPPEAFLERMRAVAPARPGG